MVRRRGGVVSRWEGAVLFASAGIARFEPIDPKFAGNGTKAFNVTVYREGSDLPVSTIAAGPTETSGDSFVQGAGRYSLKIASLNAKWTITADTP